MEASKVVRLFCIFMVICAAIDGGVEVCKKLCNRLDLFVRNTRGWIKFFRLRQIASLDRVGESLCVFHENIKIVLNVDLVVSNRLNQIEWGDFGLCSTEAEGQSDDTSRREQWQTIFHVYLSVVIRPSPTRVLRPTRLQECSCVKVILIFHAG